MRHDYSDRSYQEALLDLFKPGSGARPPLLAGREQPLSKLGDFLRCLKKGEASPGDAVLYGPRGNGKTVLLRGFEAACQEAGFDTLALSPTEINNETELAGQLLHSGESLGALLEQARPNNSPGCAAGGRHCCALR